MTADELKNYEEDVRKMRPLDDDFMREIFRNNIPLVQFVLRIITGINDLVITEEITQYDLKRLLGSRSICLDVLGRDSKDQYYDLEVQRSNGGAKPKRARYHSSCMDVEFLDINQDFDELPITYTIFITENDVFGNNQPLYPIERINMVTNKPFDDGEHILYVNGAYENINDESDIAKLMHDFRCYNADDMYFDIIAEKTRYFKETPEGVSYMCKIVEDRVNKTVEDRVNKTKYEIATNFLMLGTVSNEDISKATKLPIEKVKELSEQLKKETA